jgi:predicted Zn-dependent protease
MVPRSPPAVPAARPWFLILVLLATTIMPSEGMSASNDRFASAERARYATLCHARRDLDSCSDAVRWSPGDPALVTALADALLREGRVPEALRDYRRAETLAPGMRGLDAKIKVAEARLDERNKPRKAPREHTAADEMGASRFSNLDPETQSH